MANGQRAVREGRNGGKLNTGSVRDGQGGRPKGPSFAVLFEKVLAGKITSEVAGKQIELTRKEQLALSVIEDAMHDEDPNVRLRATAFIVERMEGKATQGVELSGADGGPIAIDGASEVQESILEKMVKIVKDGK